MSRKSVWKVQSSLSYLHCLKRQRLPGCALNHGRSSPQQGGRGGWKAARPDVRWLSSGWKVASGRHRSSGAQQWQAGPTFPAPSALSNGRVEPVRTEPLRGRRGTRRWETGSSSVYAQNSHFTRNYFVKIPITARLRFTGDFVWPTLEISAEWRDKWPTPRDFVESLVQDIIRRSDAAVRADGECSLSKSPVSKSETRLIQTIFELGYMAEHSQHSFSWEKSPKDCVHIQTT